MASVVEDGRTSWDSGVFLASNFPGAPLVLAHTELLL